MQYPKRVLGLGRSRWPIHTFVLMFTPLMALADGGVTFTDIAANDSSGFTYRRGPSSRHHQYQDFIGGRVPFEAIVRFSPLKANGAPGVAVFDYDRDGDLDIYVTNGPGAANSLYSSLLIETGSLTYWDVAVPAGVDATAQDSSGVAFGDIDNDGDHDLYVLGTLEPNRLFENRGDGTFVDITLSSGTGGLGLGTTSASMGDVNNDGLLDIVVANTFDLSSSVPIFVEPVALNQDNELFLNVGGNQFIDVSTSSGILDLRGFVDAAGNSVANPAGITWAVSMADIDLDGDVDILFADDQAAIPPAADGGVDRGILHLLVNDGTGQFTDVTVEAQLDKTGSWMGLSFGDFNSDGSLDLFGSNFGDANLALTLPNPLGIRPSRWFFGSRDGTFVDPAVPGGGLPGIVATPFGWGTSSVDYDNDGDTDIIFHGDVNAGLFFTLSNPGAILQNDGLGNFARDADALAPSTSHLLRVVHGSATGDLNGDGFVDIVSVSNANFPRDFGFLFPNTTDFGSPFDAEDLFVPTFFPRGDGTFLFNEAILGIPRGTLSVEINSGDNGNRWVAVDVLGTTGLTSGGVVNRDGIGAVVQFAPRGGRPVMRPVTGGASYASQDGLTSHFGLGRSDRGTVEVLWPGGVRNRLYRVRHGERILFPEIPCSIDTDDRPREYVACVRSSLDELTQVGVLSRRQSSRFLASAIVAYQEHR